MTREDNPLAIRRPKQGFTDQLFEPLSRLRGEVDRLFDDFPARLPMFQFGRPMSVAPVPALEMTETDKAYKLTAELPGVEADDLDITLVDDLLCIAGEKKEEREEKQENFMLSERSFGAFERHIRLPEAADTAKISASFKNGVLKVTVPKDEKARSAKRKIAVDKD